MGSINGEGEKRVREIEKDGCEMRDEPEIIFEERQRKERERGERIKWPAVFLGGLKQIGWLQALEHDAMGSGRSKRPVGQVLASRRGAWKMGE